MQVRSLLLSCTIKYMFFSQIAYIISQIDWFVIPKGGQAPNHTASIHSLSIFSTAAIDISAEKLKQHSSLCQMPVGIC